MSNHYLSVGLILNHQSLIDEYMIDIDPFGFSRTYSLKFQILGSDTDKGSYPPIPVQRVFK